MMTQLISTSVTGLRGPGLTDADRTVLADAVSASTTASTNVNTALASAFSNRRNLFVKENAVVGYLTADGSVKSDDEVQAQHYTSDYIAVQPGSQVTPNLPVIAANAGYLCFYDAGHVLIATIHQNADLPAGQPIAVPANIAIRSMRVSVYAASGTASQFMLVRGGALPEDFQDGAPTDRVTASRIALDAATTLIQRSPNLNVPTAMTAGIVLRADGSEASGSAYTAYSLTDYLPISGDGVIFAQGDLYTDPGFAMIWYDNDKAVIGHHLCPIQANTFYPKPIGAIYLRRFYRRLDAATPADVTAAEAVALDAIEIYSAATLPDGFSSGGLADAHKALDVATAAIRGSRRPAASMLDAVRATRDKLYKRVNGYALPQIIDFTGSGGGYYSAPMPVRPGVRIVQNDGILDLSSEFPQVLWLSGGGSIIAFEPGGRWSGGLFARNTGPGTFDPPAPLLPPRGAAACIVQGYAADLDSGAAFFGWDSLPVGGGAVDPVTFVGSRARWAGADWLGIGDSITGPTPAQITGAPPGVSGQWWMTQTAARLGANLINVGISGTGMFQILDDPAHPGVCKHDNSVASQATQARVQAANLITIAMGRNDFLNFGGTNTWSSVLGSPTDTVGAATFAGQMKDVIETIKGWNPDAILAFRTPIQGDDTRPRATADSHTVKDFADMILAVAGDYACPVFDAYRLSGFSRLTLPTWALAENINGVNVHLHPNQHGAGFLVNPWVRFLETL